MKPQESNCQPQSNFKRDSPATLVDNRGRASVLLEQIAGEHMLRNIADIIGQAVGDESTPKRGAIAF